MTLEWPCKTLVPTNVAWNIAPRTLAAPPSVSGLIQVVASDAGIWMATFDAVIVRNRDQVLVFRSIATQLEGRLGKILVPRCNAYQPVPQGIDLGVFLGQTPHSDEALFSDDTGYVIGKLNSIHASADAPVRSVSLSITIDYGGTLEPGQDFSIGERMYRIRTVTYAGAGAATLTFRPPLREAVDSGARLELDDPVCRMRLATDEEMNLDLALHRFGSPTVTFLEDL